MTCYSAPPQVPFAPRPQPDEVITSWLMRVAAANAVNLSELLGGFEEHHPEALEPTGLLDCSVPGATLEALARFCRVPVQSLQPLDLQRRAPELEPRMILRFPVPMMMISLPQRHIRRKLDSISLRERCLARRARYAHCAACLRTHAVPHVRWEWCFAGMLRCSLHRIELRDGCHHCGEVDPLDFGLPHPPRPPVCRSCQAPLTAEDDGGPVGAARLVVESAVDDAYRAALRGVAPRADLVGKATSREFRRFVHDILELLGRCFEQEPIYPTDGPVTRQDLLAVIADLIRTAAPGLNPRQSRARAARALALWCTLLKVLRPWEGEELERRSVRWPPAIRRRLARALVQRRRRRWPWEAYTCSPMSLPFKCQILASVRPLSARTRPRIAQSGI